MAKVTVSHEQALRMDLIVGRCMRCHAPASEAVARPVRRPWRARRAPDDGESASPWAPITAGVGLIWVSISKLRDDDKGGGRLLWYVLLVIGLFLCGLTVAMVFGFRPGMPVAMLVTIAVLVGVLIIAGNVDMSFEPIHEPAGPPPGPAVVNVPVCERHRNHWKNYARLLVLLTLAGFVGAVGLGYALLHDADLANDPEPLFTLLAAVAGLFVLLGAVAFLARAPIKATHSGPGQITFAGVCVEFAEELQATAAK
jgi:FtsH-binding integral membrane protein